MKSRTILLTLAIALAALAGCKSQYEMLLASNDVDAKYEAAMNYFSNKKYQKAAQLFESMTMLTKGTARDDTVQYYWGLSNYRYKDYYTAESNFAKFIENFPMSPFTPDAKFYRLDCMYRATYRYELDQNPTRACINAINEFVRENPNDGYVQSCRLMKEDLLERLDRKDLENGKLYYRMEDYLAARTHFKNILKENSTNLYREDILYYTAMSSYNYARLSVQAKQKERYLTFVDDYLNFIGEIPDSKYRHELDVMYRRTQKALGRYSGSDEELNLKAKDFEKERKEAEKASGK